MEFYQNPFSSDSEIRLCIFLITSVCVGLLALVWAFHHMHRHRGQISVFIVILLFGDLIELILNLYTVAELLLKLYWSPYIVVQFWSGLQLCGFHLHQLVALEGVLRLKYPQFSAYIFSLPCYITIFILVIAFSMANAYIFYMDPFVNTHISLFSLATSLASLSLLVVTFLITCKACSTPVSKNTCPVFTVAIFTFVMLYLPYMLFICVNFLMSGVHISWYMMCLCLMSLRVISDPILCVLVSRGNQICSDTTNTHRTQG